MGSVYILHLRVRFLFIEEKGGTLDVRYRPFQTIPNLPRIAVLYMS